jgi:hypothetical protein
MLVRWSMSRPVQSRLMQLVGEALEKRALRCDTLRMKDAERLPAFLEPSSRLTARLRTIVQAIVGAFTAQAGARFGAPGGLPLSSTTFLHSLHQSHRPPVEQGDPVGMDAGACTRGKRDGTVRGAVESHGSIDLLPDRETARVKNGWMPLDATRGSAEGPWWYLC